MTNNIYAVGRSMGSAPFYAYDISASSTFLHKVSVLFGIFYDKITQSRTMNMKEGIGTCGLKIAKEITLNPIEIGVTEPIDGVPVIASVSFAAKIIDLFSDINHDLNLKSLK